MKYKINIERKDCVVISEDVAENVEKSCVRRYFFENGDYKAIHPDFIIEKSLCQSGTPHIRRVLKNCILHLSSDQKKLLPDWLFWIILSNELKK